MSFKNRRSGRPMRFRFESKAAASDSIYLTGFGPKAGVANEEAI
jgi:hypothetical protein